MAAFTTKLAGLFLVLGLLGQQPAAFVSSSRRCLRIGLSAAGTGVDDAKLGLAEDAALPLSSSVDDDPRTAHDKKALERLVRNEHDIAKVNTERLHAKYDVRAILREKEDRLRKEQDRLIELVMRRRRKKMKKIVKKKHSFLRRCLRGAQPWRSGHFTAYDDDAAAAAVDDETGRWLDVHAPIVDEDKAVRWFSAPAEGGFRHSASAAGKEHRAGLETGLEALGEKLGLRPGLEALGEKLGLRPGLETGLTRLSVAFVIGMAILGEAIKNIH
jgi:hypothetical protein